MYVCVSLRVLAHVAPVQSVQRLLGVCVRTVVGDEAPGARQVRETPVPDPPRARGPGHHRQVRVAGDLDECRGPVVERHLPVLFPGPAATKLTEANHTSCHIMSVNKFLPVRYYGMIQRRAVAVVSPFEGVAAVGVHAGVPPVLQQAQSPGAAVPQHRARVQTHPVPRTLRHPAPPARPVLRDRQTDRQIGGQSCHTIPLTTRRRGGQEEGKGEGELSCHSPG